MCVWVRARARARSLHSFVHVRAADARASRARGNRSAPTATTSRFEVRQIYAGLLNAREAPFADSAVVTELPTTFRPPTRKHTAALPPLTPCCPLAPLVLRLGERIILNYRYRRLFRDVLLKKKTKDEKFLSSLNFEISRYRVSRLR